MSRATISEVRQAVHNSGQESHFVEFEPAIYAAGLELAAPHFGKRLSSIWRDCDGMAGSVHNNLAGRKNLSEFLSCVTALQVRGPWPYPRPQVDFHRRLWLKVDSSKPAGVAIGVGPALGQPAEHDCRRQPATSAAAWSLANVGLPTGTPDLDRNIDSIGAVGTDFHIPCEDIAEMPEIPADDCQMLSYLGL